MPKEYIDKSALYEKIAQLAELARNRYLETPSSSLCHSRYMTQLNERTALKHIIADFPSADVAPVRYGHWNTINLITTGLPWKYRCSDCGCPQEYAHNYCPNCGAKMDKEEE